MLERPPPLLLITRPALLKLFSTVPEMAVESKAMLTAPLVGPPDAGMTISSLVVGMCPSDQLVGSPMLTLPEKVTPGKNEFTAPEVESRLHSAVITAADASALA